MNGLDRFRDLARERLDPAIWAYLEAGADDGITAADAAAAWARLRLRPKILRGVGEASAATRLLGSPVAQPVMIAPNGRATRYHPDGELALARAAAAEGVILLLASSAAALAPVLAKHRPDALLWQQVYPSADRAALAERLAAIRECGCRAVVLTVDLVPGDAPAPPSPPAAWWEEGAAPLPPAPNIYTAAATDDLAWLCAEAGLPVVVKGVLRADDARACIEAGAAGIIVSNHGGNQLDTAVGSAEALPGVAEACAAAAEVYVDGGIRRGTSILKAIALGASGVLVGRPASHALAAAGAEGVAAMLRQLRRELERAMTLCGAADLAGIDRSLVAG